MGLEKCKRCHQWAYLDSHSCGPEWEMVIEDWNDPDDPLSAFGIAPETAAEECVERYFPDLGYPDMVDVQIRKPGEPTWISITVTAEMVPSFTAHRTMEEGEKDEV